LNKNRKYTDMVAESRFLPSVKESFQMLLTFGLVVIGWVFFRAETISDAIHYLGRMIHFDSFLAFYRFIMADWVWWNYVNFFIIIMLIVEWTQRNKQHGLESFGLSWNRWVRRSVYIILCFIILQHYFVLSIKSSQTFIYFQF